MSPQPTQIDADLDTPRHRAVALALALLGTLLEPADEFRSLARELDRHPQTADAAIDAARSTPARDGQTRAETDASMTVELEAFTGGSAVSLRYEDQDGTTIIELAELPDLALLERLTWMVRGKSPSLSRPSGCCKEDGR